MAWANVWKCYHKNTSTIMILSQLFHIPHSCWEHSGCQEPDWMEHKMFSIPVIIGWHCLAPITLKMSHAHSAHVYV